ncbi:MAG: tetratricopeptide repeat protein [Longimicrobiales bacterium]
MPRLTLDEARDLLPQLDELRPVFDHLVAASQPDPARTWSGSGRLGTAGARLVATGSLGGAAAQIAEEQAARLGEVYAAAARALVALEAGDRGGSARALLDAAAIEEQHDRQDRAEAYAASAYRIARDGKDAGSAALSLRRWARASRALGKLPEALDRYVRAYEAGRAISDAKGAAEAAVGAGNVLEDQGRWGEAAEWYRSALQALDGIDAPLPERWHAQLCLHIVARSRGSIEESLAWLERASESAAAFEPETSRPFLMNARGQLAMARGDFAEAEQHLRSALASTFGARARVTIRLNLAETLLAQSRALDAAEQARDAEREAIVAGLVPKLPEVYRLLGRIASADGDVDAFVLFERALALIRERGLPALEEAQTLQAYAEAEARRGDASAASELRRQALDRFEALGINHLRTDWADVYGPSMP